MTTQFDRLIKISPYDVEVKFVRLGFLGNFWWGDYGDKKPYDNRNPNFIPHIDIDSRIKEHPKRTAVLVHEIGHAVHYRRRCKCYIEHNRYITELHAERFTLRFMLRYKLTGALHWEMKDIEHNSHGCSEMWQSVCRQIMSEKIWIKCKNFIDNR